MKVIRKILFYINELIKIYSSKEDSYFSKKRIESGIAFMLSQIGMITFFIYNLSTLTTYEAITLFSLEFAIAGYIVNHIQKQKKDDK